MELALDSIDTEAMEIEANAEKLRAHELVKQFKAEMGKEEIEEKSTAPASEKQIDIDETEKTGGEKEQSKTVGKKEESKS